MTATIHTPDPRVASGRRFWAGLALACLTLTAAACDTEKILEVTDPDVVTPENLDNASALPTIRATAMGDFALAYSGSGADGSGGTEGIIMMSGMLADELINSETFPTRIEVDRRGPILATNGTTTGWFRTISRARRSAEFGAAKYRALAPDTLRESGLAEVLALAGFTYLFFAENWCSGVPFSEANADGTLTYGPPLSKDSMLARAQARFTEALAIADSLRGVSAATRTLMISLARVGLGRALLDRGQFAAAQAAVTPVLTSFNYVLFHSENSGRQNNGVFVANVLSERYSVADREGNYTPTACVGRAATCVGGGPGLLWRSAVDARTPFQRLNEPATVGPDVGFDGATPQFDALRYGDATNGRKVPITVATGAEARLIEAEAFLVAGDTGNFRARHDGLRTAPPAYLNSAAPGVAAIPNLGALTTTGLTSSQIVALHFSERGRWLWLTGHRLGDMRRLVTQWAAQGFTVATVFPSGAYFKQGFTYGNDVSYPVPQDELNNPQGVLCDNTIP